jgi:tetratricopeptide (TPR) repeat protein
MQKMPEAVKAWQRGLEFTSESVEAAEASLMLGETLIQLNRPGEALRAFQKAAAIGSALERGRFQAEALAGMGRAEQSRENWEDAGRHFLSVSVLFDDPVLVPACLEAAAESFDRAGQPDRAAAARREREQRFPDAADAASTPDAEETP